MLGKGFSMKYETNAIPILIPINFNADASLKKDITLFIFFQLFKKRIYEFKFIKNLQIFNTFSYSNVFYRNLKLI